MKKEAVDLYLSEIPFEIRNSLKPLSKDKAFAIYIAILKNDELRYNQIKECFSTSSSGEIDRYLKELSRAGLVKRISKNMDDIGVQEKAYYQSTNVGKKLIRGILDELLVKSNRERKKNEISINLSSSSQEIFMDMRYDKDLIQNYELSGSVNCVSDSPQIIFGCNAQV